MSYRFFLFFLFFFGYPVMAMAQDVKTDDVTNNQATDSYAAPQMQDGTVAELQALDKVTGRIYYLKIPVGKSGIFSSLNITVKRCRYNLPDDSPESVAFLVIDEKAFESFSCT